MLSGSRLSLEFCFRLLSRIMGWFLLLSATGRELGLLSARSRCMVDGQLATQTAMNDVEALLGRLTSRYGDEAVWQLSAPSKLCQRGSQVFKWNMRSPHSSYLAHAAYIG